MPDYDFYHGLYSGQQVDSAVARALVGGQLDQDIAAIRAAVGSPLVATTAAEMTNINKIYVYTGSEAGYSTGHWYYYEGGEWNDGGLYNSAAADDAMSDSSTNAVQNKVIKEYVDTAIYAEQTRAEGVESLKAPLASPALTGTPTAPTAAAGTANTQIATTAYADNAVAAEKARAEAVEATKADKSYADYILLREEEDRQILFGSVVEAAEDEYPELRSAPIHNAITIGGSVYPRMDRTRMAIDRILGRTVAFNQRQSAVTAIYWPTGGTVTIADGVITYTVTSVGTQYYENRVLLDSFSNPLPSGRVILSVVDVTYPKSGKCSLAFMEGGNAHDQQILDVPQNAKTRAYALSKTTYDTNRISVQFRPNETPIAVGDVFKVENPQTFDLTQMYGSTTADAILAMEQATTGAGVAYVRQRLDLDYYASNSGELKAPVVSGVTVTGFNLWDEETELGGIDANGSPTSSTTAIRAKNYFSIIGGATYYCKFPIIEAGFLNGIYWYDADKDFISLDRNNVPFTATAPQNACYALISLSSKYGTTYNHDICINLSKPTGTPKNGDYLPYQHTSLSIPSTRLDGVGTAQDYIEVVEDGENDYSLHLHRVMGEVDLGSLTWTYDTTYADHEHFYSASLGTAIKFKTDGVCPKYIVITSGNFLNLQDKEIVVDNSVASPILRVRDTAYTSSASFKTAMDGVMLAYELATPTETVIASHLTLAEVSAIAENGGIISVENSNGHIVQPNVVMDTVISRSAS